MTTETPGDSQSASWTSIPVPEQARQHLEAMCAARARGHWADELDDWSELIGSLDREQRKALIPVLAQAG